LSGVVSQVGWAKVLLLAYRLGDDMMKFGGQR